jgi:hypothetical protein
VRACGMRGGRVGVARGERAGERARRGCAREESGPGRGGGALAREARRAEAEHTQRAQATGRVSALVLSTCACARLLQRARAGARGQLQRKRPVILPTGT